MDPRIGMGSVLKVSKNTKKIKIMTESAGMCIFIENMQHG